MGSNEDKGGNGDGGGGDNYGDLRQGLKRIKRSVGQKKVPVGEALPTRTRPR